MSHCTKRHGGIQLSYTKGDMIEDQISNKVISLAIQVHNALGPGLLESAYRECLFADLVENGFCVEKEKPMPIVYNNVKLDHGYQMDLLIENRVVIEIKTVEYFTDVHLAQVLSYLRLGNYQPG